MIRPRSISRRCISSSRRSISCRSSARAGVGTAAGVLSDIRVFLNAALFSQRPRCLPSPHCAASPFETRDLMFVDLPRRPHYRCSKDRTRPSDQMSHTSSPLEPRSQIDDPSSPVARFGADEPLMMDAGVALAPWQIAYQTYGTLNAAKSNAVLICHALTGDQHVANVSPVTGKPGWWTTMVGPGKPIDTDRFFVICANVIGGCIRQHRAGVDQSGDRPSSRPRLSRRDHPRHGAGPGGAHRPARHREPVLRRSAAPWAACRCCNGPRAIPTGSSRPCRSRPRRGIRRRTSRSTRSVVRRSWPTRTGAAAIT